MTTMTPPPHQPMTFHRRRWSLLRRNQRARSNDGDTTDSENDSIRNDDDGNNDDGSDENDGNDDDIDGSDDQFLTPSIS
jgi:hypothetical protein